MFTKHDLRQCAFCCQNCTAIHTESKSQILKAGMDGLHMREGARKSPISTDSRGTVDSWLTWHKTLSQWCEPAVDMSKVTHTHHAHTKPLSDVGRWWQWGFKRRIAILQGAWLSRQLSLLVICSSWARHICSTIWSMGNMCAGGTLIFVGWTWNGFESHHWGYVHWLFFWLKGRAKTFKVALAGQWSVFMSLHVILQHLWWNLEARLIIWRPMIQTLSECLICAQHCAGAVGQDKRPWFSVWQQAP